MAAKSWADATGRNRGWWFIDVTLRGAGQVMFQDNPLTGLLFIIGIAWGAGVAGMPAVAVGAVLGLLVSTVTAIALRADEGSLKMGLYGFNGILVGAALPTFLQVEPMLWLYVVVGAAVSTVVMQAVSNVLKTWTTPALTFPFVLTTWFLLLGAYAFAKVPVASMGPPGSPAEIDPSLATLPGAQTLLETAFVNVAQVFLIDNVITGAIFLVAIAISSRWSAGFAIVGSVVALIAALALGADTSSVTAGLFGFSAVLTGIALGSVFNTPGVRVFAFTLLAIVFTVIVQGALDVALTPIGIPTLTAPFVVVTWLFLLPKENLAPVPHRVIKGGAMGGGPGSTDPAGT